MSDDEVIDAMREHGLPSVWVRWDGEAIKVITTNASDALNLLERAVKALKVPENETLQ